MATPLLSRNSELGKHLPPEICDYLVEQGCREYKYSGDQINEIHTNPNLSGTFAVCPHRGLSDFPAAVIWVLTKETNNIEQPFNNTNYLCNNTVYFSDYVFWNGKYIPNSDPKTYAPLTHQTIFYYKDKKIVPDNVVNKTYLAFLKAMKNNLDKDYIDIAYEQTIGNLSKINSTDSIEHKTPN